MFESLRRGWHLTKVSFTVLRSDPEILALPLMAGALLAALWFGSYLGLLAPLLAAPTPAILPIFLAIFGLYVATYFVVIWFNAAVMEMATLRFNGGDPTIMDGLKKAAGKSHRIFQWAIIAATVGLILNILREMARDRNSFLGQILVSLIGTAWNILTFFVLPVAVYRDVGPIQAIKESGSLVKRTFGDSVGAMATTGLLFLLIGLPGGLLMYYGSGIVAAIGIVWVLAVTAVSSAVNGILVAACYKLANEGTMPQAYQDAGIRADYVAW